MPRRSQSLDRAALDRLALEQDGVLGRDQLGVAGADRHYVGHRIDTGTWRAVGSRVVVRSTGELTFRQRLWVAVLHSGPDAVLGGLTAAEADGLRGVSSTVLHTVVPHGADATPMVDVAAGVHVVPRQSRRLRDELVHPVRRPRRLLLAEALVDAAESASSDDRARLIVISAAQQRLLLPAELRRVVEGRPRVLRRSVISWAIDDAEGGVHSLPERQWMTALRRYRLPEPVRQQPVRRADGTWYLDADFQPWNVGVEINGSQHARPGAIGWDDHRRNVLGIGGRLVITLSSHVVRHRAGVAVVATAAGLLSRGWEPSRRLQQTLERLAASEGLNLSTGDWLARHPRAS